MGYGRRVDYFQIQGIGLLIDSRLDEAGFDASAIDAILELIDPVLGQSLGGAFVGVSGEILVVVQPGICDDVQAGTF